MKDKTIYDLELHETIEISNAGKVYNYYTRVPNGWVFITQRGEYFIQTFIPYSDEFKNNEPLEMD